MATDLDIVLRQLIILFSVAGVPPDLHFQPNWQSSFIPWPSYVTFYPSAIVSEQIPCLLSGHHDKEKINIFSFLFFFERKNESRSWDFGTLEQARAHGCNNDRVGNPVSSVWHVKNWVPFTLCFIISYVMSEVMPLPSSVFLF